MIARVVLVVAFAVLYGLAELPAISNLIELPQLFDPVPWWLLIAGVAIPPIAFAAALLLGRGREAADRALLLLVGLAATHALALGAVALAPRLLGA